MRRDKSYAHFTACLRAMQVTACISRFELELKMNKKTINSAHVVFRVSINHSYFVPGRPGHKMFIPTHIRAKKYS